MAMDIKLDSRSSTVEQVEIHVKRKETEDITTKHREKIKQALKFEKEPWRTCYDEHSGLKDTGQWLNGDSKCSAWAGLQPGSNSILALEAREGFGKSFPCPAIVRNLKEKYPSGQNPRVSVAYYFFQKGNKDDKPVNKAVKAVLWQYTQNGPSTKRLLPRFVISLMNSATQSSRGNNLVIYPSKKIDSTFFIILDGINEVGGEPGKPLMKILRDISEMVVAKASFASDCP
jgi:hypothetical protein